MTDSQFSELRELDLLKGISDTSFDALMRGAYLQTFPPQIELTTEGDPSDFLHVVLSGAVELFGTWNGRETSMATVRPVSTFILAATIKDAPYLMSARTLSKSRIALIPSADVRSVFSSDADFARAIVAELAQSYRAATKNIKNLKLRNSFERLANYLLRQQERAGGSSRFELTIEKRKVASYLGMTAENLSRAFNGLKAYGVTVDGNQITITDQDLLTSFAKPDQLIDDFTT